MNLRFSRWVGLLAMAASLAHAQVFYVGDNGDGTIKRVDALGNVTAVASGFANVYGLAADAFGNVFVSSTSAHKIVVISPASIVSDYATDFPANAYLMGMTFDSTGNLYVADMVNGIYKVAPGGGTSLWATGMSYPRDIALNDAGAAYVVGGYNPMSMYAVAADGTPTLFAAVAASAGFTSIDFGYADYAYVGGSTNALYHISPAGVVNTYQAGIGITDLVYVGNGTTYFLANGSLYRDVAGSISTFATAFINPTAIAFTAVPEPSGAAALLGMAAAGWILVRRCRRRGT